MKKFLIFLLVLTVINTSWAQANKKAHKYANFSTEEIAELKTKKMTLFLDLNKSQQDDIYKLNLENAKLRKAHMLERKANKKNAYSKKERLENMHKILDHKIATKEKMKGILNGEQYTKWKNAQEKRARYIKMKRKKRHFNTHKA